MTCNWTRADICVFCTLRNDPLAQLIVWMFMQKEATK